MYKVTIIYINGLADKELIGRLMTITTLKVGILSHEVNYVHSEQL